MSGLPDTVETLTGLNIKNVMKRLEGDAALKNLKSAVDATD
jgi:hypothetical protein